MGGRTMMAPDLLVANIKWELDHRLRGELRHVTDVEEKDSVLGTCRVLQSAVTLRQTIDVAEGLMGLSAYDLAFLVASAATGCTELGMDIACGVLPPSK